MNTHKKVSLAIKHMDKSCIGEPCDLEAPCKRHNRTIEVVMRLARRVSVTNLSR